MNKSASQLRNLSVESLKPVLKVGENLPLNISFGAKSHGLPKKFKKLGPSKISLNSKSIQKKSLKKIDV